MADEVEPAGTPALGDGARIALEGFITDFVSAGTFDVLGILVRTTAVTAFENGNAASLAKA